MRHWAFRHPAEPGHAVGDLGGKSTLSVGTAATAPSGTPAGILTVRSAGEQISLPPDRPFVIGRAVACDLVVNDGRVSRRHLMLEPTPDGWTAIDISANGTWHAGERVQRLRI